jgi:two-component system sensor histidine kinase/response regulator
MMSGGPLDLNTLAHMLGHDAGRVHEFALVFLSSAHEGVQELTAALAHRDLARMRELGHKLKTSAHIVGAPGIAALCESLEQLPPSASEHEAAPLVAQLTSQLEQASRQILQQGR